MISLTLLRRHRRKAGLVDDQRLKFLLLVRDGPAPRKRLKHRQGNRCRFPLRYPNGACPWCAAEERRMQSLRAVASL
jgi:hypothetical protein